MYIHTYIHTYIEGSVHTYIEGSVHTLVLPMCLFEFGVPGSAMTAVFELANLKSIHV